MARKRFIKGPTGCRRVSFGFVPQLACPVELSSIDNQRAYPTQAKKGHGFTLIELMVTLTIAVILLTVAVPSYQSFVASTELTTSANDLIAAINLTRSESVKRDAIVSLQSTNQTTDFAAGYCIVVGDPGNCSGAVRQWEALGSEVTLTVSGASASVGFDGLGGLTSSQAVVFDICRDSELHRRVTVSLMGRPKLTSLASCPL
jgi:type IV fimbrial biogenesis protein FimT